MPRITRVRGSDPGRVQPAHRTLLHYAATCRECEELPKTPRETHVHAITRKHTLTESRHYIVEPPE